MGSAIQEKYDHRADEVDSLLCVGLDTTAEKAREVFPNSASPQLDFNKQIIDLTGEYAAAFKPNLAFYEAEGEEGLRQLRETVAYIQQNFPNAVTIGDAKRADIESTNTGYVKAIFDTLGFDAVTLHPYLGRRALKPFLDRVDKACIVLCRTSNPEAGEFQDLIFNGKPLWQIVTENVSTTWNDNNNVMLVVGATYPEELRQVREIVGEMTLLVPGIGAQGGEVEKVVRAGQNKIGKGMIINSSRGIIYATDPRSAARDLRDQINDYRR